MVTRTSPMPPPAGAVSLRPVHLLLAVQSVLIVLLSVNRLSGLTLGYVLPNEFLRWYDLHNMLFLPIASTVASFALWKVVAGVGALPDDRARWWLGLLFVIGVYLLAAGYGDHEVTNYLHSRFCPVGGAGLDADLCRIVVFNDDAFSHYVFFLGYIAVNTSLMLLQVVAPWPGPVSGRDLALVAANGLFIALGIFANLAFEEIGLDLVVVALLAVVALALLRRHRRQPLLVYYSVAYALSSVATLAVQVLRPPG
jgi:hypothetical protein